MDERVYTLEQRMAAGQLALIRTKGVSMQPLLYEGESHVIVAPAPDDLAVGDLALAKLPDGRYLLHRVIGKDPDYYYTRGDNCYSEEAIPRKKVVGVAVEIGRRGRRISMSGKIYRLYAAVWMESYPVRAGWWRASCWLRRKLGR